MDATHPPAAAAPAPPRPVQIARWLWIGGAVLSAGRSVVRMADRRALADQIRHAQPNLGQDEVSAAVSGTVLLGLMLSGLLLAGYVLLANRMAGGANWARIVLAVIGGGSVLFGSLGLLAVGSGVAAQFGVAISPLDTALGGAGLLVDAVALTLMFVPAAQQHFRRRPPAARTTKATLG